MAQWKATDTIPNIMGGPDRITLRYAFYEDALRQIAYVPARSITAPTVIVQGDKDEHVPLHQSRQLYEALRVKKHLELLPGADHQFTKGPDFTTDDPGHCRLADPAPVDRSTITCRPPAIEGREKIDPGLIISPRDDRPLYQLVHPVNDFPTKPV